MTDPDDIETLAGWLREAQRGVAFTGAGISTESGVPDFRSPGSPWMVNKPIPFQAFVDSEEARQEAWRRKFRMDDLYAGAQPSFGHGFFARRIREGRFAGIVTQNIDGLHHASGVPGECIVELHGNGTYATCLACAQRHELDWVRREFEASTRAPRCLACGGVVKSATISFGQAMPEEPMRRARDLTEGADVFVVAGSSLVVFPAANLPVLAKRRGARLIIINREATDIDPIADLVVHGEIGTVLSAVEAIL